VHAGDAVWNPLTGEKAVIVESADESAGARIVVDLAVEEGGFVPAASTSTTTAPSTSRSSRGRSPSLSTARNVRSQPETKRPSHRGAGTGGGTAARARWWLASRIEPALRFEEAILAIWGFCADGHTNAEGRLRRCSAR
jgi:hypothetical protein